MLTATNVDYEVVECRDARNQQHTLYRYTIYKLEPYKEEVLAGEKRTFEEAEDEAMEYMRIVARAWSSPVCITGP